MFMLGTVDGVEIGICAMFQSKRHSQGQAVDSEADRAKKPLVQRHQRVQRVQHGYAVHDGTLVSSLRKGS